MIRIRRSRQLMLPASRFFTLAAAGSAALLPGLSAHIAYAQASTTTDKSSPEGGTGLKVDLGYRYFNGNKTGSTYINLNYQGNTLYTQGASFTDPTGYTDFPTIQNSNPDLQLSLNNGVGTTSGTLANFLKVGKITGLRGYQAIVQVYGNPQTPSSLGIVGGIEKSGLSFRMPGVPNFLAIGVEGGTQPSSAAAASTSGTTAATESRVFRATSTGDTTAATAASQRGIGIVEIRQNLAYCPLDTYSTLRKHVMKFAVALAAYGEPLKNLVAAKSTVPSEDSRSAGFYAAVLQSDPKAFDKLLIAPAADADDSKDATNAEAVAKEAYKALDKAFADLTDDDKKQLLADLKSAAPFLYSNIVGTGELKSLDTTKIPQTTLDEIWQKLKSAKEGSIDAKNAKFISEALSHALVGATDWATNEDHFVVALRQSLVHGGLVLVANTAAAKDDKRDLAQREKDYARTTLGIVDPVALARIDGLIDLANKQTTPSAILNQLTAANRAVIVAAIPELAPYIGLAPNVASTLQVLYKDKDRPQSILQEQFSGQYYVAGDPGNGGKSRTNELLSVYWTRYQHPEADQRTYFRVRYDNGRDHAAPTTYLNQWTATVGLEF